MISTKRILIISTVISMLIIILSLINIYTTSRAEIEKESEQNPVSDSKEDSQKINIITLHYHERSPYYTTTENGVNGLIASIVSKAFNKAGIPFEWKKTPSNRQLKIIQDNLGFDGIIGWFKNPEREQFGKFSHYIYQDKPFIAITKADNSSLFNNMTVDSVLSNQNLILEVKDGYSYGAFLDEKIKKMEPVIDRTTSENIQMLNKIQSERADYFFIAPEEAESLIELSGLPVENFKYINFSDMPKGEKRYIIFSRNIKDDLIVKLNGAIEDYILEIP